MILHLLEIVLKISLLLPALEQGYLLLLPLSSFYYQYKIYLSVFSFIICSYLLLSEFMRPLRPVQYSLTITCLMRKLTNESNLENTGTLVILMDYLAVMDNKLKNAYSA